MSTIFCSRVVRRLVALIFAGALLLVGYYGLLLIVEAFDQHGSSAGNAIFFIIGLTLLVLSPFAFIVGISRLLPTTGKLIRRESSR